jgi:hypothetical protein
MASKKAGNSTKRLKKAKKLEATKPLKPTMGDIVVTKPTDISAS